ncbi:hypothetical protein D779_1834 [Imhoffiella purpurea]|uniref:Uncharacterized protein n=1 Tax=Imhoffiella purpurea TaxID=1249627 RepID=W9VJ35_9GAMM|nr:hypothetical protein D779_1834 [Imhoffiella purpurea]
MHRNALLVFFVGMYSSSRCLACVRFHRCLLFRRMRLNECVRARAGSASAETVPRQRVSR